MLLTATIAVSLIKTLYHPCSKITKLLSHLLSTSDISFCYFQQVSPLQAVCKAIIFDSSYQVKMNPFTTTTINPVPASAEQKTSFSSEQSILDLQKATEWALALSPADQPVSTAITKGLFCTSQVTALNKGSNGSSLQKRTAKLYLRVSERGELVLASADLNQLSPPLTLPIGSSLGVQSLNFNTQSRQVSVQLHATPELLKSFLAPMLYGYSFLPGFRWLALDFTNGPRDEDRESLYCALHELSKKNQLVGSRRVEMFLYISGHLREFGANPLDGEEPVACSVGFDVQPSLPTEIWPKNATSEKVDFKSRLEEIWGVRCL